MWGAAGIRHRTKHNLGDDNCHSHIQSSAQHFNKKYMENKATVRIYIDGKEMLYSHQNIIGAINSFLPYLTNDDLDDLGLRLHTLKGHRRQKEYLTHLAAKVIPIQKNRHDTP